MLRNIFTSRNSWNLNYRTTQRGTDLDLEYEYYDDDYQLECKDLEVDGYK